MCMKAIDVLYAITSNNLIRFRFVLKSGGINYKIKEFSKGCTPYTVAYRASQSGLSV